MTLSADEARSAELRDRAVALLARREHSRQELQHKLAQRGYGAEEINTALQQLQVDGYQSDARYAESLIRSRIAKAQGPLRIRAELAARGVADDLVEAALQQAEQETDWLALASDLLQRRHHGEPATDFKEKARRMRYLQRRGFPASIARHACNT